jgi:putative membrane protein insertion efficiency factor
MPRSGTTTGPISRLAVFGIGAYQKLVSPLLGRNCRFSPTCSSYAAEAITRFGLRQGAWLAIRRLGRCQPLHEGGYDPVPEAGKAV